MFLLKLKMDFPGLWFCSKRANYWIWLGPEQTHTLLKTLLFKLTLNYLNQPAEAEPHFHQAMLRKTVPHAAHCFCWQWTSSWHFKYNFTNSYYCTEQLYYKPQDESETAFLQNERFSVQIFFRHSRTKLCWCGQLFLNWILIDLLSILTLYFL